MNNSTEGITTTSIIEIAKYYAIKQHSNTNHLYGEEPYSVHLNMVYYFADKYKDLIESNQNILASAYTHDLIEDCRVTYNDVKEYLNTEIADITYALTNEKGKTRDERANSKYYEGIIEVPGARFIKICDRLANATYSKEQGSRMLSKYKSEMPYFRMKLYHDDYSEMFAELVTILK